MKRSDAVELFGSVAELAAALGVSRQRIYQMPQVLDQAQADRVIGAAIRTGRLPPDDPPLDFSERVRIDPDATGALP